MSLYIARVSDTTGRVVSLEELLHNEGRTIEEYLSDMGVILNKSYSYILHGYKCELSFIKLYFPAINIKDAAALAERLSPLHRKGGS